jgi:ferredoxin
MSFSPATPQDNTGPRPRRRALPVVDPSRCTGCGWCVAVCGPHVLSLSTPEAGGRIQSVLLDEMACTGCALCAVCCPFDAIAMARIEDRLTLPA